MLDEPVINAIAVGKTWNGSTPDTGCYTMTTVLDSTNTFTSDIGNRDAQASIGLKILRAIGLDAGVSSAKTWNLTASGARVIVAQNLQPRFDDHCQVKRNSVPRFPAITALIGFDSMSYTASDSSGKHIKLSSLDSSNSAKVTGGATLTDSAGRVYIRKTGGGVWVGFHLLALEETAQRTCTWSAAFGTSSACPKTNYDRDIRVERLPSGRYVVSVTPSGGPNPITEKDTVAAGDRVTSGVGTAAVGTLGEWYSIVVQPTADPNQLQISITKHTYRVVQFLSERDRNRLEAFLH